MTVSKTVSTKNGVRFMAYPSAKRRLEELVHDVPTWVGKRLEFDLETKRQFVYSRKGGVDVFYIPLSEPKGYDAIVRCDPKPRGERRPAWVIEKIVPEGENKLRQLTPVEKAMLRIIGPLSVR